MLIFYLTIAVTVLSNVLYHVFLKLTPQGSNPVVALSVTYGTSFLACILCLIAFPPAGGWSAALSKINWTSAALGLSILGLEFGFLLAYRAGWDISKAGIVSATAVAVVLIPVGVFAFKERLSLLNGLGLLLCILGLVLVNLKP
jgi:drug/metabolite transporter (DMT)-like permease